MGWPCRVCPAECVLRLTLCRHPYQPPVWVQDDVIVSDKIEGLEAGHFYDVGEVRPRPTTRGRHVWGMP